MVVLYVIEKYLPSEKHTVLVADNVVIHVVANGETPLYSEICLDEVEGEKLVKQFIA